MLGRYLEHFTEAVPLRVYCGVHFDDLGQPRDIPINRNMAFQIGLNRRSEFGRSTRTDLNVLGSIPIFNRGP